jgi:hypothetical protein
MKERLTKPAGRNATYRGERILEIIDKLTDIENKEQSCIDVLPEYCHERLTLGTLNGNSIQAKKNNKLFILENAMERGGLVSTEWHNEQVMQLQTQLENSVELPAKPGTELYFISSEEPEHGPTVYNIISSSVWRYIITSKHKLYINECLHDASVDSNYDYVLGETVFADAISAQKGIATYLKNKNKVRKV